MYSAVNLPFFGARKSSQDENAHAHHHVQGVQAGHGEVQREEDLRRPLLLADAVQVEIGQAGNVVHLELLVPFVGLDAEEGDAQNQGQDQPDR